jgi:hypothetical protein
LLRVAERPNLIDLDPLRGYVAQHQILVLSASRTNFFSSGEW